ncbi:MAG: phosphohydrolase, partial [Gemmatimonadetes bacterium]
MSSDNFVLWLRALGFAAEKHRNQRRKDADASPYINHPIAVASILAIEAAVTDEVTLLAALLHDTVEDTETNLQELEQLFGAEVAALVGEMSDDKSLPKEMRKQLQVEHAPGASPKAKRLKIADKICNIRDVAENPPARWSLDRRRGYLDWA